MMLEKNTDPFLLELCSMYTPSYGVRSNMEASWVRGKNNPFKSVNTNVKEKFQTYDYGTLCIL
jgi:hypothetical protein